MKPGPSPKPTAMKIAAGNPGKRKINKREPKPPTGVPDCPAHLKDEARREWYRTSGILHKMGILSDHNRATLAMFCKAYGRWVEAEEHINENGAVVKSPNGYPIQNPYLAVANKAMDQMIRLSAGFGMTPADMSRLSLPPKDDGEDIDKQMLG